MNILNINIKLYIEYKEKMKGEKKDKMQKKSGFVQGEEKYFSLGWIMLIICTLIGSILMTLNIKKFLGKLRDIRPDYPLPKIFDFSPCLVMLSFFMTFKIIIESALVHVTEKIMNRKFFEPEQAEMRKMIKKKLAVNIFKCLYYTSAALFGYFTLINCEYYPTELGGYGSIWKILEKGYPNSFFFEKPRFFIMHYCYCLSYSFVDIIWLVFIYPRQSDFYNMLLHHICAICLTAFSYMINFSNLGSIILVLHNASDIVVYINRIALYSRIWFPIMKVLPFSLLLAFGYRLYFLNKILYSMYFDLSWDPEGVICTLWVVLCFLYLMHANWTFMFCKKIYVVLRYGEASDSFNYNKFDKNKNLTETHKEPITKKIE